MDVRHTALTPPSPPSTGGKLSVVGFQPEHGSPLEVTVQLRKRHRGGRGCIPQLRGNYVLLRKVIITC